MAGKGEAFRGSVDQGQDQVSGMDDCIWRSNVAMQFIHTPAYYVQRSKCYTNTIVGSTIVTSLPKASLETTSPIP